jgi:Zn-finger nucleic acid-binding protein
MNCPKCKAALEPVRFQSVEVDRCIQCKGLWLDLFEDKDLKGLSGSEAIDVGDRQVGQQLNQLTDLKCPADGERMIRTADPRNKQIQYELCTGCRGIFLDAGEFKDLKESSMLALLDALMKPGRK